MFSSRATASLLTLLAVVLCFIGTALGDGLLVTKPQPFLTQNQLVGMFSGFDESLVPSWQNNVNRQAQVFTSNLDDSSRSAFDSDCVSQVNNYASDPRHIVWGMPMNTVGETLASIVAGTHDASITACAQKIFNSRSPFELQIPIRIGWEFNLSGAFPWYSGGQEATYIAAWQHMVGLFRAVSARFVFDWCPNWAQDDPETSYPGDAYVDIVGMDTYYDIAFDDPDPTFAWQFKVSATWGLQWQVDYATAHSKRLSMPEWGINSDNKQAYVALEAAWYVTNNYLYNAYWWSNQAFSGILTAYPATNAGYQAAFGPAAITTGDTTLTAGTSGSIALGSNETVTWAKGGSGAGSFGLSGSNLTYTTLTAGTYLVNLTALNSAGFSTTKTIRILSKTVTPMTTTFLWTGTKTIAASTFTFTGQTLGNGITAFNCDFRASGTVTLSGVTINGVTATVNVTNYNTSDGNTSGAFIVDATNAGGTGDYAITMSGSTARIGCGAFELTGASGLTPFNTAVASTANNVTLTTTINTADSGAMIAGAFYADSGSTGAQRYSGGNATTSAATGATVSATITGTNVNWSGVTERYDASLTTGSFAQQSMVVASWGPS